MYAGSEASVSHAVQRDRDVGQVGLPEAICHTGHLRRTDLLQQMANPLASFLYLPAHSSPV